MSRIRPNQLLLPSILDRLLDFEPKQTVETPPERAQRIRELRASVRRDLEDLLNTRVSLVNCPPDLEELRCSVLNYGIPDFGASQLGSNDQKEYMRKRIEEAIRTFETRFQQVRVIMSSTSNEGALHFRIEGTLYAEPAPEPVNFESQCLAPLGEFRVGDSRR
ncbi:MAG: type VI secretion system baseplate subunit TssE [Pirellulaceae bacterium]|nr:type VI secretion system baseplate subunit TssE [Pirellulaceae bacterium]